jgi:hypothetical protein
MTRVSGQQRWLGAKVSEAIYRVDESASGHTELRIVGEGRLATAEASATVVTLCSS